MTRPFHQVQFSVLSVYDIVSFASSVFLYYIQLYTELFIQFLSDFFHLYRLTAFPPGHNPSAAVHSLRYFPATHKIISAPFIQQNSGTNLLNTYLHLLSILEGASLSPSRPFLYFLRHNASVSVYSSNAANRHFLKSCS